MNFLFRFNEAIPVVPEPINGSRTISFSTVNILTTCSTSMADCSDLCNSFVGGADSTNVAISGWKYY